jgi:peptidoglycan/xylan/chitin deacetylase (PgdA/CDA1 family)
MNATTRPKTRIQALLVLLLLATLAAGIAHWHHKLPWHALTHSSKAPGAAPTAAESASSKPVPSVDRLASPPVDHSAQVIVLGYHRFVDKVRHPDTEITPAEFEGQMQALKDQGIAVISMDDFLAWRRERKSLPPRCAMITIDDGYNVGYTVAWPILKKFGYPFTMFIYTDYVRGGSKAGGGSMTWEQLAEMRDAGVSIQSHTVSHPDLRRKKAGASQASYDEWLWNELHGSKATIEERLGIKVIALALPYGLANDHVREVAGKAGYEMVFTVNGEKAGFSTPMEALGRYVVQANQPKLFKVATTFEGTPTAAASTLAAHHPHTDAPSAPAR